MRAIVSILSLAAAISFALPAQANVLVVSPTGTYTTIQQAVDAAVDDDVILVKSGTYPSFVVRGKSLVIAEDTGHTVLINGAIRIGNINGTRTVNLIGLQNTGGLVNTPVIEYGLRVVNSSGLILVQDCALKSATRLTLDTDVITAPRPALLVENSYSVVLSRCTLTGGNSIRGQSPSYPTDGMPYASGVPSEGAYAVNSGVSFFECSVTGGPGRLGPVDGSDGGHGLVGVDSAVFLSGTTVRGGNGGVGSCSYCQLFGCFSGDAGHGLLASGSTSCRMRASTLLPGVPGPGGACFDVSSTLHAGAPGQPARLTGMATLVPLAGPAQLMNSTPIVREQQQGQLTFTGAVGDIVDRYSSRIGSAFFDAAFENLQVPNFAPSFRVTRVGIAGPSLLIDPIPIPELGVGVKHRVIYFQGAHMTALGLRLGTPRAMLMLDSAY